MASPFTLQWEHSLVVQYTSKDLSLRPRTGKERKGGHCKSSTTIGAWSCRPQEHLVSNCSNFTPAKFKGKKNPQTNQKPEQGQWCTLYPTSWEAEVEDIEFKAKLAYNRRHRGKKRNQTHRRQPWTCKDGRSEVCEPGLMDLLPVLTNKV